jgi:hypothetical protein
VSSGGLGWYEKLHGLSLRWSYSFPHMGSFGIYYLPGDIGSTGNFPSVNMHKDIIL